METKLLEFGDKLYTKVLNKPIVLEVIKVDETSAYIQNIRDEHPRGIFQVFRNLEKSMDGDEKWIAKLNLSLDDWILKFPVGIIELLTPETNTKYQHYLIDQEIDKLLDKIIGIGKENPDIKNTEFFSQFIDDMNNSQLMNRYFDQELNEDLDNSSLLSKLENVIEKIEEFLGSIN